MGLRALGHRLEDFSFRANVSGDARELLTIRKSVAVRLDFCNSNETKKNPAEGSQSPKDEEIIVWPRGLTLYMIPT